MQTVQTQFRGHRMLHLMRVYTAYLHEPPTARSGLIQMIRIDKSTSQHRGFLTVGRPVLDFLRPLGCWEFSNWIITKGENLRHDHLCFKRMRWLIFCKLRSMDWPNEIHISGLEVWIFKSNKCGIFTYLGTSWEQQRRFQSLYPWVGVD